ncbi:MAG: hypothetical protein ABIR18_14040 [Chitinophagaceae bacterium]
MTKLHYLKWPLITIVVGFILWILGAMMKVLHWMNSDLIIVIATGVMIAGLLFLIGKLIALKK